MPRKPRFFLPDIPVHIIIRGNNRQVVFTEKEDNLVFMEWLGEGLEYSCSRLHAYVLMSNHVHLLVSAGEGGNISRLPHSIGRKYVPFFNRKYGCTGTIWEGRFKASSIDSENYLLVCYRYIEMNPVRAGMVGSPEKYRWSSYRANALGEDESILSPHRLCQQLGADNAKWQSSYRELFTDVLDCEVMGHIRASVQTGTPLGNNKFKADVEKLLGTKVGQARQGRPRRRKTDTKGY
jgi:putative transposase